MALSKQAVEKAYKALHEIKVSGALPELQILSFPTDMSVWSEREREDPPLTTLFGWDRKVDDGWENLVFFVKNPSDDLVEKFNEVKRRVPNSSMCRPHNQELGIWIFGWF